MTTPQASANSQRQNTFLSTYAAIMETPFNIDAWQGGGISPLDGYSFKNTPFDEYWNALPPLRHAELNATTLYVQGHSFRGRMAVLKYLMFEMDTKSFILWGTNCQWHWLWGYASQLDWQHRSGRLSVGSNTTNHDNDTVSTESWWNYMNFMFSICILLGAQRAGVLDTVKDIQLDAASEKLVANDTAVQECIASWQHLFSNAYQTYQQVMETGTSIGSKEFGSVRFQLQQHVWIAHTSVIHAAIGTHANTSKSFASPRAAELMQLLPQPEQDFGLGWCRMVEIIAACTFPTDLVSLLEDGAGFLPLEIVTQERLDEWQSSPSLTESEARRFNSIKVSHELLAGSPKSLQRTCSFWQRVVRTYDVSRAMPGTIQQLSRGTTRTKLQQVVRLFYLYIRPRGTLEWSVAIAVLSVMPAWKALKWKR